MKGGCMSDEMITQPLNIKLLLTRIIERQSN